LTAVNNKVAIRRLNVDRTLRGLGTLGGGKTYESTRGGMEQLGEGGRGYCDQKGGYGTARSQNTRRDRTNNYLGKLGTSSHTQKPSHKTWRKNPKGGRGGTDSKANNHSENFWELD